MMSSEERKQIVGHLYRLIKESPLFRDYTDERIREAAVRAELKAYSSSSTKEEYLRAMNNKMERIKNAHNGRQPDISMSKSPRNPNETNEMSYSKPQHTREEYRRPQQLEKGNVYYDNTYNMPHKTEFMQSQPIGRSQHKPNYPQQANYHPQPQTNYPQTNYSQANYPQTNYTQTNYPQSSSSYAYNSFAEDPYKQSFSTQREFHNEAGHNLHSRDYQERPTTLFNNFAVKENNYYQPESRIYNKPTGINENTYREYERTSPIFTQQPTINSQFKGFNGRINTGRVNSTIGNSLMGNLSPGIPSSNQNESFVFINDMNGSSRMSENKSFGHSKYDQGGYPGSSHPNNIEGNYITDRGFHSNKKLYEQNNYQDYIQSQSFKPQVDYSSAIYPSNLKYRSRYDELPKTNPISSVNFEHLQQETSIRRGIAQTGSGVFQKYPQTSPIGMTNIKKTDRSFSIENQAARGYNEQPLRKFSNEQLQRVNNEQLQRVNNEQLQRVNNEQLQRGLNNEQLKRVNNEQLQRGYTSPANRDHHIRNATYSGGQIGEFSRAQEPARNNYSFESKKTYEPKPAKRKVEIDETKANDLFNSIGSLFDQENTKKKSRKSPPQDFFDSSVSPKNNVLKLNEKPIGKKLSEKSLSSKSLSGKSLSGKSLSGKGLSSKKLNESKSKNLNENELFSNKKHLYRSQKSASECKSRDLYEDDSPQPSPSIQTIAEFDNPQDDSQSIKVDLSVEASIPEKPPKNIPKVFEDFIVNNKLSIMETSEQNVNMLKESLQRCEETQAKASKVYAEHKQEFPNSKLHQAYLRTMELIDRQREALAYEIYFLTWRCVDDLLDNLKGTFIDMRMELANAQKTDINFPEAINNAFNAFASTKKRDDDFVLDLRDK